MARNEQGTAAIVRQGDGATARFADNGATATSGAASGHSDDHGMPDSPVCYYGLLVTMEDGEITYSGVC